MQTFSVDTLEYLVCFGIVQRTTLRSILSIVLSVNAESPEKLKREFRQTETGIFSNFDITIGLLHNGFSRRAYPSTKLGFQVNVLFRLGSYNCFLKFCYSAAFNVEIKIYLVHCTPAINFILVLIISFLLRFPLGD